MTAPAIVAALRTIWPAIAGAARLVRAAYGLTKRARDGRPAPGPPRPPDRRLAGWGPSLARALRGVLDGGPGAREWAEQLLAEWHGACQRNGWPSSASSRIPEPPQIAEQQRASPSRP